MRYLGVPLLAKRLGVKDCASLIDNVEKRINCWKNRFLSYAGRMQLIASVLATMQQYWASVYLLPDAIFKKLERIFKSFLWNARGSAKGKARVAWNLVCRPKEQGGLGLKPLRKWNEVLLITQIWKIIENKESLWVKWVNTVKLKNKSFWEIDGNSTDSWGWKNMLKIRDKIKPYVFYEVGNGNSISAWYDKWCDQGPLNRFITNRDIYDARLKNDAKLSDLICNGNWIWPDEWGDDFPELNQLAVPNLNQRDDRVKWVDNNNKGDYSTRNAWLSLRINCLKCSDSHGHLFFECKYSKKIWNAIAAKGRFTDSGDNLETIVKKLETSTTKNNMWLIVDKFIVFASVYFIWNERNKRNFQQVNRNEEDLVKTMTKNIEEMLMSLKVKRSNSVLKVAST
ncbi:hypothetical protein Tco_0551602 [Tanacetum coccineum]